MSYSRRSLDERYSTSTARDAEAYERRHSVDRRRWRHRQHDYHEVEYAPDAHNDYSSLSRYGEGDYVEDRPYYSDAYHEARSTTMTNHWSGGLHTLNASYNNAEYSRYPRFEMERSYREVPTGSGESPSGTPPPLIPTSPSPEYLKIAAEPSEAVPQPSRKLIILDLNGTLLVRVRSRGSIHPRPYMPAFRDFLLCHKTREWLDVMVWSSAQPRNVERMVRRCFFDDRFGTQSREVESEDKRESNLDSNDVWEGKLIAVWARDKLGLSRQEYSQKSQTTKDLEKPWSALPGNHGAKTTVLLDDSPRKARLQPFNHVCVDAYTLVLRDHDVSIKRRLQHHTEDSVGHDVDGVGEQQEQQQSNRADDDEAHAEELTERQKERKKKKAEKKKRQIRGDINAEQGPGQTDEYDPTLLAVIGILDALKHEGNVAGWIRSGGLWAGKPPPASDISTGKGILYEQSGERMSSPTDLEISEHPGVENTASSPPESPGRMKRQRSTVCEIVGSNVGEMKRTRFNDKEGTTTRDEHLISPGNDAQTIGVVADAHEPAISPIQSSVVTSRRDMREKGDHSRIWFEDEDTFRAWVDRGRAALKLLGIDERDGIDID